jgi:di/tricarboxylate transporter
MGSLNMKKKTLLKSELNVLWHSTGFPSGLSVFLVVSVYLLVRMTMEDKNKAVVCCLLATSAIMLSEKKKRKRKMWSKKWCLERNISCGAELLNELNDMR